MNRKKSILISLTGITIVMLALLGLTYGYYITNIIGNTNSNSISITTSDLKLVYADGNDELSFPNIEPGWSNADLPKTFTVTNSGTNDVGEYAVGLDEITNTLNRTEDLTYTITCTQKNSLGVVSGTCNGASGEYPKINSQILTNSIKSGYTHEYSLVLSYVYLDDINQSEDMGSTIKGRVQIYSLLDTIDITGTVASYNEGDYVQINSNPKTSQLIKNSEGKYEYKFIGVPIGSHTLSIRNISDEDTPKGEKTLTIKQGETAGYGDSSLTITNNSRTASVNLGTISNNTFDLTMSTPLDRDTTPPTVTITLSAENPKAESPLTSTITHSDSGSGVDITKSKWIINQVSTNINGLQGYTWTKFTTNPETITLTQTTSGTYYLHIVSIDKEGNVSETIKTIEVGEPLRLITFYINSDEYTAEEGMTWEEWINSMYNVRADGYQLLYFYNGNDTICDSASGSPQCIYDATKDDIIIANKTYSMSHSGGSVS